MIPDSEYTKRTVRSSYFVSLSSEDQKTLLEAFEALKSINAAFPSLDSFIQWYLNIYGQLAFEMLIQDCRKALREKDQKKLLHIVSALSSKAKQINIEEVAEVHTEQIANTEIDLSEDGFISFAEISELVSKVESRLSTLVEQGDLTSEQAEEIITELKDIEIGKFASLNTKEFEEIISTTPLLEVQEVEDLILDIDSRESLQLQEKSKLFGEEGFLSIDTNLARSEFQDPELSFAEVEERMASFEAELVSLVEYGTITSEQAYELKDAAEQAPLGESLTLSDATIVTVTQQHLLEAHPPEFFEDPTIVDNFEFGNDFDFEPRSIDSDFDFIPSQIEDVAQPIELPSNSRVVNNAAEPVVSHPSEFHQPQAENFVPVTLFQPGTRPSSEPTVAPIVATDVAPNVISQPKSFAKPDVPTLPEIDDRLLVGRNEDEAFLVLQQERLRETQLFQQPSNDLFQPARSQQTQPVPLQPQVGAQFQPDIAQPVQPQSQQQQNQQLQQPPTQPEVKPIDQKEKVTANEPRPEETDFKKGPCQDCNQDCSRCGVLNAEHIAEKLATERGSIVPIAPIPPGPVSPGAITPAALQPNQLGIEPRTLAQPSLTK